MTSSLPPSPVRPRVGVRDVVPILLSGVAMTLPILVADYVAPRPTPGSATAPDIARVAAAVALGLGLALVLALMQGRADELTPVRAVKAWLAVAASGIAGAYFGGALDSPGDSTRLAIVLAGSTAVSALLYLLRKRNP